MLQYELNADYIELSKLLKITRLCNSGGEAKIAITSGQVKVNGQIETRKRKKIEPGSKVEYQGQTIDVKRI